MENIEKKLDSLADLLGIPKDVHEDMKRMTIIQARITTCLRTNRAISRKDTEEYNRMCYRHFSHLQDGSEFEKEAVPVGKINVKTEDIEELSKPHWIPVEERRAEIPCICCDANGNMPFIPQGIVTIKDDQGVWQIDAHLVDLNLHHNRLKPVLGYQNRITYWMPLPQPPKEGKADE